MSTTVWRPYPTRPYKWQAYCVDHQTGYNGTKPSAINWAEQHVKNNHPGEKVIHQ